MIDYLLAYKFTTDDTGSATMLIKVPGTFSGLSNGSDGRYLVKTTIWTKDHVDGDKISSLAAKDLDGVLPVALRGAFASYPILLTFSDTEATYGGNVTEMYVPPLPTQNLGPINPLVPRFIPSGVYIYGIFTAGTVAANRELYINIQWQKLT